MTARPSDKREIMIEKQICEKIIARVLASGADYAEIYAEDKRSDLVSVISGNVENALSGRTVGAGIRAIKGTNSVYAYGNDISEKGLSSIADKVCDAVGNIGKSGIDVVLSPVKFPVICPVIIPPCDVEAKKRTEYLKRGCLAAKAYSEEIKQVTGSLSVSDKNVLVANSDGVYGEDRRAYVRIMISAVASDGRENQNGRFSPGTCGGFEYFDTIDPEEGGRFAARQAVTMLHAGKCPAGKMPVIMGGGFGGVIFHEACGHSLEATSVAKGNSVFCGMLGQKIANEKVTAYDDGTMTGQWGSIAMSDEGEKSTKILLIENGILKNYMIDKLGSIRMGMPSTGSGRRQDYSYAPTSRMTNTYIAAGTDKEEDIFASVDNGLYAAHMGGGSVNPVTGEFNFSVQEGYLIKNGKIAEPVRGATLIGKGAEVLMNIDMVSDNMTLAQGMCGSSSGSIPTNVGQPTIRISNILVGGDVNA